ncbi:hypothetical protein CMI38_01605 [Candidatus Pacearchaeota archaeon]|jgi:mRNA-degrading endonuclease RelE of RelBE toxin-antitoxin system|nr:hypothetical protein [Candidatus Pacearchaeota archaeon]|tara:strand:+ start:451 stop:762 length:312 start_codon:yes stop_codon:yes gene_type:complete
MIYDIFTSKEFDKELEKISEEEKNKIIKLIDQIKENPYVGDQLQIRSLREKRIEENRMYYLVFDDLKSIFLIAISNKKDQQKMIDFIKENINTYRKILKEFIN